MVYGLWVWSMGSNLDLTYYNPSRTPCFRPSNDLIDWSSATRSYNATPQKARLSRWVWRCPLPDTTSSQSTWVYSCSPAAFLLRDDSGYPSSNKHGFPCQIVYALHQVFSDTLRNSPGCEISFVARARVSWRDKRRLYILFAVVLPWELRVEI